ncbi:MAG: bifunctional demethylmenaquinone methyltransferase/2-methoxy-6-polyprenyl-1,4-benzoquinol methylase UbiE [Planctomycetes bacterium]|nr:bifunctional demethylmenaquinone methyltransferase/2-methoxy-6-polyprenyl-1,4-benzoquinol methylase UbiE [Planctomycetota bacterium]
MFSEIAPKYDFLNRLLSFGIDRRWRRHTRRRLDLAPNSTLLDLCCGTGDLALEFAQNQVQVWGADFTYPMLPLAKQKADSKQLNIHWAQANAQALPYADESFDAITIAFGIRNVFEPKVALGECIRVLKPGGKLAILEFFPISSRIWGTCFRIYFHHILPVIARIVRAGRTGAYRYLPESVASFATVEQFQNWMQEAGFEECNQQALSGGVARLVMGTRPEVQ